MTQTKNMTKSNNVPKQHKQPRTFLIWYSTQSNVKKFPQFVVHDRMTVKNTWSICIPAARLSGNLELCQFKVGKVTGIRSVLIRAPERFENVNCNRNNPKETKRRNETYNPHRHAAEIYLRPIYSIRMNYNMLRGEILLLSGKNLLTMNIHTSVRKRLILLCESNGRSLVNLCACVECRLAAGFTFVFAYVWRS